MEAKTPADALALVLIAREMLVWLVQNADGNEHACEAATVLHHTLKGAQDCLVGLSDRPVSAFAVVAAPVATPVQ